MKFSETIEQASDLLQRKGRLSYRTLNWFTEAFDTKDLQEAKGLIEELSH